MNLGHLYQQTILEHNKNPRNFRVPGTHNHHAHGKNPVCGDDYFLYLNIENGLINDIGFQGEGCAISKSSASMMSSAIKGKSAAEALVLLQDFIALVTNENCTPESKQRLGKLAMFEGVKEFPVRVKCASLIWRALEAALTQPTAANVTTE